MPRAWRNLVELAVEFAQNHMQTGGALVAKVFHGAGYDPVLRRLREAFVHVETAQTQGLARPLFRDLSGGQ
jgi:23S rRNA U2552 (ribose-2'-O)-methylase RlmE/FtsJ